MDQVVIRPARPDDRGDVRAVVTAAFGAHADLVVRLVDELHRTGAVAAEHVAESDGAIVGFVLVSRGWVDVGAEPVVVDVLSPLAVMPSRQGSGIGRALVEHAVNASERSGVPAVFLEGDPAYYSRHGFVAAVRAGFRAPSARIPEPAFQVRLLAAHEQWMSGALVYPDAFWTANAIGPA